MRCEATRSIVATLLFATVSGCASSHPQPPSARQQAASGEIGAAFLQWTGKFGASQQQTGAITVHVLNVVHGNVRLTALDANMTRAQIDISVDMAPPLNDNYKWSLSSGDCRSNTIPALPVSEFPPISIVNNRGQLDANISLPLPTSGRYHVNVFWSNGADEGDVMTCSELKLERRTESAG